MEPSRSSSTRRWPLGARARARGGSPAPDAAVDAVMILAIGLAQAADAITFVRMVRDHGLRAEANPFVAHLASMGDVAPLVVLKVLLALEVVAVVSIIRRRHPAAGGLVATIAVLAGLVGAFSNLVVIVG
ncbi:MAG TPA: hypothetical protein VFY23_07575 [Candidatus Limnocylindrales bacterium]|nr:hypothetical protein [Candidatus Limnocylindrales bacterium]